jgi:hypothetical protein
MKKLFITLTISGQFAVSCSSGKTSYTKHYSSHACDSISPLLVDFKMLVDSAKKFEGKFIETEGIYAWSSEESAITSNYGVQGNESQMIWVSFSKDLQSILEKDMKTEEKGTNQVLRSKKIKLRGLFTSEGNGHQGGYAGTILDACYVGIYQQ